MRSSLDLLFQIPEQFRMEKIFYGDPQSVAQFFDRRHRCTIVSAADDIVHSGLRDTAHSAELVDGNIAFSAQFYDPLPDSISDVHVCFSFFRKSISKSS